MKQIIFLLLFAVVAGFGISQCATVSSSAKKSEIGFVDAEYECSYKFKFLDDTIKMIQGIEDEIKVKIGGDLSCQYSYNTFWWDSASTAVQNTRNHEAIEKFYRADMERTSNFGTREDGRSRVNFYGKLRLYKDYQRKKIVVLDNISIHSFLYEEELAPQVWTIQDDTMTLSGYLCQKAICDYRGRSYEAWFTSDIPIYEGPWKFYGLPGLIMKLHDTQHHYEFELIEFKKINEKIDVRSLSDNKLTKMEREKFYEMKFGKKSGLIMESDMAKVGFTSSSSGSSTIQHQFIERDF